LGVYYSLPYINTKIQLETLLILIKQLSQDIMTLKMTEGGFLFLWMIQLKNGSEKAK
jgi:hypothetical protein